MKTIIFSGPSLSRARLRQITDADIADPIRRGDLAARNEYDVFLILDGEFAQSLSVSPKEILKILDQKKTVIGASSMGALRASELDTFGMIGVGWIYERFAKASVRRDDEVALTYSPLDFVANSVPLVNVEYWLERLCAEGHVSARERAVIVRVSRKIFFAERTEKRLFSAIEQALGRERLTAILEKTGGQIDDIKSLDAERAVAFAAGVHSQPCTTSPDPGFRFGSDKEP